MINIKPDGRVFTCIGNNMDIKSTALEKACGNLVSDFSKYFDWSNIGINYTVINVKDKTSSILSSDYEWILKYWGEDFDLLLNERLNAGIQYWNNYSDNFTNILRNVKNNAFKVDFCMKYGDTLELMSINAGGALSVADMMDVYKWKPVISDYAGRIWKKNEELILPLRPEIRQEADEINTSENNSTDLLDVHQYMRFGNIRFTRKEILTIRLILSHRKIKEISAVQGCSEASEHKRIQRIKEKLGCPHASSGGVFNALKENGITLACLDTLVNLP